MAAKLLQSRFTDAARCSGWDSLAQDFNRKEYFHTEERNKSCWKLRYSSIRSPNDIESDHDVGVDSLVIV